MNKKKIKKKPNKPGWWNEKKKKTKIIDPMMKSKTN